MIESNDARESSFSEACAALVLRTVVGRRTSSYNVVRGSRLNAQAARILFHPLAAHAGILAHTRLCPASASLRANLRMLR